MMQLISLFSGIGGFELAAEWMGWDVIASCEINPFGQRVLKHYWPEAYHHDDIHTLTHDTLKTQSRWDPTRPTILTGGFPCQPYSMAGKRKGKEDDRHLWPQMCRIIREVRPDYIVGENVLGLVSWDGGLVFDEVHTDLEREGYEVQAVVIPAAAVNAPHGRDRVWFCAREIASDTDCTPPQQRHDSTEKGRGRQDKRTEPLGGSLGKEFPRTDWSNFPTQPPVCSRNDGIPAELDGITFSKWRNESIKAAGNAIVPQVAYSIFRCIQSLHH